MGENTGETSELLQLVQRMREGDETAKERLVAIIYDRLTIMSRRMLKEAPAAVARWDQTGDLLHSAWFRIERALEEESVHLNDESHFFRLIARHLRFQLIELYRKNVGARGLDANYGSVAGRADAVLDPSDQTNDMHRLTMCGEFHEQVEKLEEREKAVVDLLWYEGLTHEETASLLGVNVKTVQRAWRRAKIQLAANLDGRCWVISSGIE